MAETSGIKRTFSSDLSDVSDPRQYSMPRAPPGPSGHTVAGGYSPSVNAQRECGWWPIGRRLRWLRRWSPAATGLRCPHFTRTKERRNMRTCDHGVMEFERSRKRASARWAKFGRKSTSLSRARRAVAMTSAGPGVPAVPLHLLVPGGRRALLMRIISRSLLLASVGSLSLILWIPPERFSEGTGVLGVIAFMSIYLWGLSIMVSGLFAVDRRPFSSEITRWG